MEINFAIDRTKLREKMAGARIKNKDEAAKMGITDHAFSMKKNGHIAFKEREIAILLTDFGTDVLFLH